MNTRNYCEIRKFVRPLVDQFLDLDLSLSSANIEVAAAIAAELMAEGFSERRRIIQIIHRMVPNQSERHIGEMLDAYSGKIAFIHRWSVDDEGRFGLLKR